MKVQFVRGERAVVREEPRHEVQPPTQTALSTDGVARRHHQTTFIGATPLASTTGGRAINSSQRVSWVTAS